jgi:predicted nucleotidyltransferase
LNIRGIAGAEMTNIVCGITAGGRTVTGASIKAGKTSRSAKTPKEAVSEERVKIIMDTILENVDNKRIKKIYLFGSYAYGRPDKDSDIDICLVVTDDTDITETYMKFAVPLLDKGIMPVDKLVYHESEFMAKRGKKGIVNTIVTKGSLLYG